MVQNTNGEPGTCFYMVMKMDFNRKKYLIDFNRAENCVYHRQTEKEKTFLVLRGDDLIIAVNDRD